MEWSSSCHRQLLLIAVVISLYTFTFLFSRNENHQALQGLCSEAVELLASCRVIQLIESQITSQLKAVFGEAHDRIPLAVRSSAAGKIGDLVICIKSKFMPWSFFYSLAHLLIHNMNDSK